MTKPTRGAFIASSAAVFATVAVVRGPARAAEFSGKAGTNQPVDHPLSVAMKDLWDNVRKETNGRVDVTVFPNNQLGGDTAMLQSQGMAVNTLGAADRATMKAKLPDYYKRWKAEFGITAWDLLESYTGKFS